MEITEIKTQLTITAVLEHYGLKANQNNMLCCPFHDDKTPSLQIYPQTNTFCCFSSNCKAGTGDVIEFIRLKENVSKHEAILKAKALLNPDHSNTTTPGNKESGEQLSRTAVLTRYVESCKKGIAGSERARTYVVQRGLDWQVLKPGFAGDKVPEAWNKHYRESAAAIGLINKTEDGRYVHRFRNCLVFALVNAQGQPAGIYGRGLDKGHYYLPGTHQGLYPAYPKTETKKLILTEAVIDAASLQQQGTIVYDYSILACYGTNGFTAEHETAISELKLLDEVILFFDGDEAGKEGSKKLAEKLHALKPSVTISHVNTPEGEDVNSLMQGHEPEIFTHLIAARTIIFSVENRNQPAVKNPSPNSATNFKLEIFPHRFLYRTATASYHIKGALQGTFETLRVSLDIEHPVNGRKSRSKVDLYEDKQVEKLSRDAAEKLALRADLVQLDLEALTNLLDAHREKQSANKEEGKTQAVQIPPHIEAKCKDFLTKPNLIND